MKEKKPKKNTKEKKETSPLEGKYVIARWREVDTDDEIEATFLYKVKNGKVESIFGQSNLNSNPRDGSQIYSHEAKDYLHYNEAVIELIKKLKINEVYVVDPYKSSEFGSLKEEIKKELGLNYEFIDFDQPGVDYGTKNTVHNWGELDSSISSEVLYALKSLRVKVSSYNFETKEISDY